MNETAGKSQTKQKMMEQDLSRTLEFNRKLLATIPDVVILTDLDGIITYVNDSALASYPFITSDNLIGSDLFSFIAPKDINLVRENFRLMLEKPLGIREYTLNPVSGVELVCEVNGDVVRDEHGNPSSLVCVIRDITGRRKAEEMLQQTEQRLLLANKATNDVIWDWDAISDLQQWNEAGTKVFGWTEIVEHPVNADWWVQRVHQDDRQKVHDSFFAVVDNPESEIWREEYRFLKSDGTYADVMDRGYVIRDSHGKAVRMVGAMVDITAQKRAAEAIHQNRHMLDTILNTIPQSVFWKDRESRYLGCNKPFAHAAGLSNPADIIGKTDFDLPWSKEESEAYREDDRYVMNNNASKYHIIETQHQSDGSNIWIDTTKIPLLDSNSHVYGVLGVFEDITQRKLAKAERESALSILHSALTQSPSGILIADAPDVRIRWANEAALMIRGQSDVPLSGIDVEKHAISWQTYRLDGTVMPSEELPLSRAILKGETVRNEEVIIRHSSGEDHYVSANAAPIRNAEGEITAGIVVFHDITENKRAARALAESTQKFQLIVENMSDGFWLMDLDLKTTWISPSIIRHRGYTLEEIQTLPIESQFIPESAQLVEKIIEEELTPERLANPLIKLSRTVELGFLCKDGSVIWTDTTYSVIRDSDGKPQAILGVGHDITDKKRAEEERKASEKNYRELFTLLRLLADNMPDMLWAKNLNKEFIFANKAICSNLLDARDTEEPIGKTDLFFAMRQRNTQPDNPEWHTFGEICQDSDTATLQAMKPMQFDEFGNVNGKFLFLDVYKAPLYDEKGQLIGLVGSARDVTATKEAENQLRKLSLAVEQSPASVVITNLEGTIEYVNPKFSEVTGYSSEEAIGKNPNILKSGKLPDEVYAGFWETISSGSVWKGEFHNKKKNGELFWESVSVSPIKNENGEISHYLAVKEDITDSKRSEIARKIQYNIARSIHTAKSETELLGIISQELGQLLDFSIFFAARYQSDQGTLQQLTCGDETGEMDEWNVRTSVSGQVIRSGKTIFLRGGEIAAFCMQHNLMIPEPAPACWLGVPMVINNQVGGVMVIQHDSNPAGISKADVSLLEMIAHETGIYLEKQLMIEDLIVAKEKAEESDRLKTHFLNNISHEIRTPLNGIMGFSDLILDESLSQEEKKHYHHILQQSSNRLQQTITDIIDIAELKAGTISLTPENMEVRQVLARLTDKFRYACSRKNVILSLEVDPVEEKTFLKTDKELLVKILQQLLDNAVKFTDSGRITVGIKDQSTQALFFVKDTGKGISADKLETIFEPFMQEDVRTTRGHEGNGLGLAIARGMVGLLGGKLWVESVKGEGSAFYFTLPGNQAEAGKEITGSEVTASKGAGNLVVLIAEDDEASAELLQVILQMTGFLTLRAWNGEEAVNLCYQYPDISLVFMDIKMPGMNGLEATAKIKAFRHDLPVIALTAYAQSGDRIRMLEGGCDDYIAKPFLKATIMEILKKYRP